MDSNSFDEEGACADDVNKNSGDITNENNDDILKLDHSNYLTASDLGSVRRIMGKNQKKDEDLELYKGPKVYYPDDNPSSEEIVDGIMNDHKKSLGLQRAVKIRECVKAVWNEELKVAIVPFLKGKASQHMGVNLKGNCALSPEEALFLLEKGLIEIEHNKVSLSVEEAYALMLKGRLSVEKYEVYSFLSQQGFIVVQHQSKIGPSYEQLINLEKRKQRKRKKEDGSNGAPPSPKRTTFTGVLSSTAEITSPRSPSPSPSSDEEAVDVCDTSGELSNDVAVDVSDAPAELSNDVAVDVSDVPGELSNDEAVQVCSTPGEISNDLGIEDISEASKDPSASQSNSQHIAKNLPKESIEIASLSPDSTNRIEASESCGKETETGPQEDSHNEVSLKNSLSVEDSRKSNKNQNSIEEMVLENTNEGNDIDVENSDTNDVIIEDEPKLDKSSEVNVDESSSDDYANDDDDDSECVIPEEIESLDVNSCSPAPKILDSDSNSESSKQTKTVDDDVTLVEVKKKEKKPLAVIDLSSDNDSDSDHHKSTTADEADGKNAYEDSDDEIQVLKVCPVPGSSNLVSSRNVSSVKSESRKLKIPPDSVITKSTYKPQMKFPDLCKKDIMCLPRPPPNLLPAHVQPAKEVYVINHKKSMPKGGGRVWNSFKDMQEYQRERRRERQQSSSMGSRSGGVNRDYRSSHDTHMNQTPPFSTQENLERPSRDLSNQNFQMLSHMNSPAPFHANNDRPLLPTPSAFNAPGHMSFENIHNLQNLSSTDPAAFVTEIQKTICSVASSMICTMLGQQFDLPGRPGPSFNETVVGFNSHSQYSNSAHGPMFMNPPSRFPSNHSYPGDPYAASPFGADNWRPMQPHFQPRTFPPHKGPLFPCTYRNIRKKRDWRDVKAAVGGSSNMSDSGSDIEEVPINLNQFLWSNDIQPLVKPGSKLPVSEVLKSLQITQKANLCDTKCLLDRYMPATPTLEITFDVYLPNSNYRRSAPTPPNIRIIVMRSADPIPRYSELVNLKRKWNDEASLQVAVVDHGDINFYNFNSMDVPQMVPFEK